MPPLLSEKPTSALTTQLLSSLPEGPRAAKAVNGRNWRRFEVVEWPQQWKEAALALKMFEETDFGSLSSEAHRVQFEAGEKKEAYRGNSRFRNLWAADPLRPPYGDPKGDAIERQAWAARNGEREAFEAWVVTDAQDQEPLALMLFERWESKTRPAPIQRIGERKPSAECLIRIFGEVAFWVAPGHRGQGLGSQLAEAFAQDIEARMQMARAAAPAPFMPFVVAHDRGEKLLARLEAFPLTSRRAANAGQAQDLARAATEQEDRWPQWATPLAKPTAPARKPKRAVK